MTNFRIFTRRNLPEPTLVSAFDDLATSDVSDCMGRKGAIGGLVRMWGAKLLGTALTVRVRPGDNLMVHKAIDLALPGDVILVADAGDASAAMAGEIMMCHARAREVAGLVTDGPIRDVEALPSIGLPVWAGGVTPIGPSKVGPGEINIPIRLGGSVIMPGDIILGDADGLVVIPRLEAASILERTQAYRQEDALKVQQAREGKLDRSWLDPELVERGCVFIDDVYPI